MTGWAGIVHGDFTDPEKFRQRLDAGADPLGELWGFDTPLHVAAREGSPAVVAELACRAQDLDTLNQGRSALWNAVYHRRTDNALVLAELGADPSIPMMNGWSPAKLSLASRGNPIVHCLVYADLRPGSTDCLENPDAWIRLRRNQP